AGFLAAVFAAGLACFFFGGAFAAGFFFAGAFKAGFDGFFTVFFAVFADRAAGFTVLFFGGLAGFFTEVFAVLTCFFGFFAAFAIYSPK
ncbi:MAG: hypothetical protein WC935_05325, partial [Thermoleophilia bacterium]